MSNIMSVTGHICNLKVGEVRQDGGRIISFTVSCKTKDSKRWNDQNNNRDFWDFSMYLASKRSGLINFLENGKAISVAGTPYQSIGNDGKTRYTNINTNPDLISFVSGDSNRNSNAAPATNVQQTNVQQNNTQQVNTNNVQSNVNNQAQDNGQPIQNVQVDQPNMTRAEW
jgi:hypothetical protein